MANPRLPAKVAEITGAAARSPYRHKGRKAPNGTRPLGEPYKSMSDAERAAWYGFADELPWLNSSHRALLQLACRLRARLNSDPDMGVSAMHSYSSVLSKLGATPVDETKVNHGEGEDEDPAERYFN